MVAFLKADKDGKKIDRNPGLSSQESCDPTSKYAVSVDINEIESIKK